MHLLTDAAFHNTAAFQAAQAQMGELVAHAGFVGIRVRRFFLAHVLVELALDALLLRREPHLADGFYNAFDTADFGAVTHWAETTLAQSLPTLPDVLTRFLRSRYLRNYADDDGVAEGLHRLSLRARQDAFYGDNHTRLVNLVSRSIVVVGNQVDALLSETSAAVAASYPTTMER